jgi:transcriptional regulator with XRE-family HTH domain
MNRIKEVLEEKGVKQTKLAQQLGKSYNMVNGYVQNSKQPRLEVLFEIAEILGVETTYLINNDKRNTKSRITSKNMENSQRCSWLS